MNVLSLFDGISCGQVALQQSGIVVDNYYASEIDKKAISITQKNFPKTIQLGDITKIDSKILDFLGHIDLIIGGSPCQGFSQAGVKKKFSDERSKLFFDYNRILKHFQGKNPDIKFLLENVKMDQASQDVITSHLGVQPILINSVLFSAQRRKRLYWTNIPIKPLPESSDFKIKDILYDEHSMPIRHFAESRSSMHKNYIQWDTSGKGHKSQSDRAYFMDGTMNCILGQGGTNKQNIYLGNGTYRHIHPIEIERLQTLPDNYTDGFSTSQRINMVGNGWTANVIVHLLDGLKD